MMTPLRPLSISTMSTLLLASLGSTAFGQSASSPQILFQGMNVTGKTTTVAVGQQVALSTSDAVQAGESFYWESKGAVAGGLQRSSSCPTFPATAPASCINYLNAPATQPTYTIYFVQTGTFWVQYQRTLNGIQVDVTTNFNVVGPTSIGIVAKPGPVGVYTPSGSSTAYLSAGNNLVTPAQPGLTITASAVQPPGLAGTFFWNQTINYDQTQLTQASTGSTVYTCANKVGLDATVPYSQVATNKTVPNFFTNNVLLDSPNSALTGTTSLYRTFQANAVLAWQANTSAFVKASIPVSASRIQWGWSGKASLNNGVYTLTEGNNGTPVLYPGFGYPPGWNSVVPSPYVATLCTSKQ